MTFDTIVADFGNLEGGQCLDNLEGCLYYMKIALVHDQLQEFGGAERVLVTFKKMYPDADVHTSFYSPQKLGRHAHLFKDWNIITSWADKVYPFKRFFSPFRFITPLLWKYFDFSKYDLVISSSGAYVSKGVKTSGKTLHICYLHHQPKYLYGYETPSNWQKHLIIRIYGNFINHFLRMYDFSSSQTVDHFLVNSQEMQRRCTKFYRRDSMVVYPPVSIPEKIPAISPNSPKPGYYLSICRLSSPKHVDLLINAANKSHFALKVVGTGGHENYLRSIAGPTVEFVGSVPDKQFEELFAGAKAFLVAAVDEEFGIAPVEAQGRGVPVIAYNSGGLKETVHNGENGFLFDELNENSLLVAVNKLEKLSPGAYLAMKKAARKEAEKYSEAIFTNTIKQFVVKALDTRNKS